MSARDSTHAIFVSALATAGAMLAMAFVAGAASGMPLHARLALAEIIGIGGVAALTSKLTGAYPVRGRVDRSTLSYACLAGFGLSLAGTGALTMERALVPSWGPMFAAKEAQFMALLRPDDLAFVPIVLAVVVLTPAIFEEWLFRGVLRSFLMRHMGVGGRVVVLGLLFSLFHGDPTVLVPMTWVGAMIALTAERAGGWVAAIVAHLTLNAFSALVWVRVAGDWEPGLAGGALLFGVGGAIAVFAVGRIPWPQGVGAPEVMSDGSGGDHS